MFRTIVFDALEDTRDGCVLRRNPSASHPAGPAVASRPAARRPTRPARGVSGFWIRLAHRISFVRASGETFKRRVFDALEGTRGACLVGELFCRRPVLPSPAPPPRHAPRPDPLVVCPIFVFDKCFKY